MSTLTDNIIALIQKDHNIILYCSIEFRVTQTRIFNFWISNRVHSQIWRLNLFQLSELWKSLVTFYYGFFLQQNLNRLDNVGYSVFKYLNIIEILDSFSDDVLGKSRFAIIQIQIICIQIHFENSWTSCLIRH